MQCWGCLLKKLSGSQIFLVKPRAPLQRLAKQLIQVTMPLLSSLLTSRGGLICLFQVSSNTITNLKLQYTQTAFWRQGFWDNQRAAFWGGIGHSFDTDKRPCFWSSAPRRGHLCGWVCQTCSPFPTKPGNEVGWVVFLPRGQRRPHDPCEYSVARLKRHCGMFVCPFVYLQKLFHPRSPEIVTFLAWFLPDQFHKNFFCQTIFFCMLHLCTLNNFYPRGMTLWCFALNFSWIRQSRLLFHIGQFWCYVFTTNCVRGVPKSQLYVQTTNASYRKLSLSTGRSRGPWGPGPPAPKIFF